MEPHERARESVVEGGKKKKKKQSQLVLDPARSVISRLQQTRALWRMFLARELASVWANYRLNEALLDGGGGCAEPLPIPTTSARAAEWGKEDRADAGRYSNVARSRARRTPASTGLDGWPWFETRWSGPGHATPYPRAAVGRRISRRWALNSRFCRAMKMSRLINTSGSPTSVRALFPSLLLPPTPPPISAVSAPTPPAN